MSSTTSKPDRANLKAHDPGYWLKHAVELNTAATLISNAWRADAARLETTTERTIRLVDYPAMNLGGVFWVNAGLALENLLKGILVAKNPGLVVNGRIGRQLLSHNLLSLARIGSLELAVFEAFYLDVATQSVTWAGRYPSAKDPGKHAPPVFSEADVIAYQAMFTRFSAVISAHSKEVTFIRLGAKPPTQ